MGNTSCDVDVADVVDVHSSCSDDLLFRMFILSCLSMLPGCFGIIKCLILVISYML